MGPHLMLSQQDPEVGGVATGKNTGVLVLRLGSYALLTCDLGQSLEFPHPGCSIEKREEEQCCSHSEILPSP